mgnify:FL=1
MAYITSQAIGKLEHKVGLNLKLRLIKEDIDKVINVQRLRLDDMIKAKEKALSHKRK